MAHGTIPEVPVAVPPRPCSGIGASGTGGAGVRHPRVTGGARGSVVTGGGKGGLRGPGAEDPPNRPRTAALPSILVLPNLVTSQLFSFRILLPTLIRPSLEHCA